MSERESAAWTDARGAVSAAGVSVPFSAASAQLPAASLQALVASTVWGAETATGSGGSESAEVWDQSTHICEIKSGTHAKAVGGRRLFTHYL
jgi:hypothetical protein